jgi:hypothetical protein
MPRLRRCLLLGLALLAAACVTKEQLASQLEQALRQEHVPKVYACWEREFESAGFRGQYVATADFVVESDTGQLREVAVRDLRPADASPGDEPDAESGRLRACVEKALGESTVASSGWTPPHTLTVRGFRFAFVGSPAKPRKSSEKRAANVLIGPRADRCLGLYSYDPPRDTATLMAELAEAQATARRVAPADRDGLARAQQKVYDLALELRASLDVDSRRRDLKEANRTRMRQAQREVEQTAREVGEQIHCQVPAP